MLHSKCHQERIGSVTQKSNPGGRKAWHRRKVDMDARKQYLAEVRREYVRAEEWRRTELLDEAQKRTAMNRKYLIRLLNRAETPKGRSKPRKRGAEYGARF